jgi:hypothetical protein
MHVRDWDGGVETLVADLSQLPAIDPSRLFPSDDKTRFGDWVKASALKRGDKVSTLGSVPDFVPDDNASGPRAAANDNRSGNTANNQPLTVTEILRDNAVSGFGKAYTQSAPTLKFLVPVSMPIVADCRLHMLAGHNTSV